MNSNEFLMAISKLLPESVDKAEWFKANTFELDGLRIACVNAGKGELHDYEKLRAALKRCAGVLDGWFKVDIDFEDELERQEELTRDAISRARDALGFDVKAQAASGEE